MTDSGGSRQLLDEEGMLLGVVNIIDALVVLILLAVVVAGVALVLAPPSSDSQTAVRYHATVSYTVPLASDAATIEAGDSLDPVPADDPLDVTDVTRSYTSNGEAHVVAQLAYTGTLSGKPVRADGILRGSARNLYGGDQTAIVTQSYRTRASVLAINQTDAELSTRRVPVVVSVNDTVARALDTGERARIGSQTIGTVVRVSDPSPSDGHALVGLEVVAWDRDGTPWFGGRLLRVDNRIIVVTNDTMVAGPLQRVGTANVSGV